MDPTTHLFWITSRAAGTAALVLAGASVTLGLSMGGRLVRGPATDRRTMHEALSLAVMVALAVHAFSLLGDQYLRPSVLDVAVPFASGYKTGWTSLGIVSGWALVLLGLSFYSRRWIGMSRWRILHRFTLLAWIAGIVHTIGEGTDAHEPWFLALIAVTTLPAVVALGWRISERGSAGAQAVSVRA
jgi:methionine sulfoxide reductase heme-binding subunit